MLEGLLHAEQLIRSIGIFVAIFAAFLARPFPPEHETDAGNPALAGRQLPYRWGAYIATVLLASAVMLCVDVWIHVLQVKPVWIAASFAGAVLSLAGSVDLFRRNWRGVYEFFVWCVFLWIYAMLIARSRGQSAPWLISALANGITLAVSAVYFARRKQFMQRSG